MKADNQIMFKFLELPEAKGLDLDSPETTIKRKNIIHKKKFLFFLYSDFYKKFLQVTERVKGKNLVEIGSGAGFLKDIIPDVILSDTFKLPWLNLVFSAEAIPFKDKSISEFFMLDVLHHIPNPESFFHEAFRCLKPGGRIVMIEPYMSIFGRFIFKYFHYEPCKETDSWNIPKEGPLSGANSALPYIIFKRDRDKFEKKFPQLKIIRITPHTPLLYLLSGGLTMRALVPDFTYKFFKVIEFCLKPISNYFSMFCTIMLEKTK